MPPQDFPSVDQLAVFFGQHQPDIITEWRANAGQLLRQRQLDQPTLTDHLPDVVAEIVRDLALNRDGDLSAEHTRGSPPVHGVQRYYDGLEVGEVVAEYNLLRVAFITVAERHGHHVVGNALYIINHRIDEAVRLAVTAFAAQQTLMHLEHEKDHLAFIAHDLRTPLNAVALLVEELRYCLDDKARTETDELFEILDRNLQRVVELVKQVLETNVNPVGNGTSFHPERRTFELWPLVRRLIVDLRSVWSTKGIEVVNEIPATLTVFADAGLLSQVFQNLLDNSFKYTPRGRVVINAQDDHGIITCTVADDGAGIRPDMLPNVFDKLTTDPEKEGTGLGLAIVKQIVEAHGGTVTAESAPGQGAKFTFTIPAS